MGIIHFNADEAKKIASKYNELWAGAEIMLFVLVGAEVIVRFVIQSRIAEIFFKFKNVGAGVNEEHIVNQYTAVSANVSGIVGFFYSLRAVARA